MIQIGIVGMGVSGITMACYLRDIWRQQNSKIKLKLYLFEKEESFHYTGPAYVTTYSSHLLNVPAKSMSPFRDDPHHFIRWSQENGYCYQEMSYACRSHYGKYLLHLKQTLVSQENIEIHWVQDEIIDYQEHTLTGKKRIYSNFHYTLFALGNLEGHKNIQVNLKDGHSSCYIERPWKELKKINEFSSEKIKSILLLGTGLTMSDMASYVHSLYPEAKIEAVSRHALFPTSKKKDPQGTEFVATNLAESFKLIDLVHEINVFRKRVRRPSFHDFIQQIRHHINHMWHALHQKEQRQFLKYLWSFWNVERHRIPQTLHEEMCLLVQNKILTLKKKRVRKINDELMSKFDLVINCLGPTYHLSRIHSPLVQNLLLKKIIQDHPLKMGAKLNEWGTPNHLGSENNHLFFIGNIQIGESIESTALPDIAEQCYKVKLYFEELLKNLESGRVGRIRDNSLQIDIC